MALFPRRNKSESLVIKELVATINGLKFWDAATSNLLKQVQSSKTRLDLTTVEGQTLALMGCAPVGAIIGRIAEYSMNGRYGFKDEKGKEVQSKGQLAKLLIRPNFFQTWAEFMASAVTFIKAHGQCYILPITPAGFEETKGSGRTLWVIPNWMVTVNTTGKTFYQDSMDGVIRSYDISFLNKSIPASQMIVVRDSMPSFVNDPSKLFQGQSRLYSLGDQVNNLIAIQDALYNLTAKRGAMGAWVPENNRDVAGTIPLQNDERDEVLNAFAQYGVNSNQLAPYMVLKQGLKWVQAAMSVNDLQLFTGQEAGISQLSMSFNVPQFLLGFKDATFTNLKEARKEAYTSAVIPCVNNICFALSDYYGENLTAWFDHLEIFQAAKKEEADALNAMVTALDKPYKSKIIGRQEYRSLIAGFMPAGTEFDPTANPTDLFDGADTKTIVTQ